MSQGCLAAIIAIIAALLVSDLLFNATDNFRSHISGRPQNGEAAAPIDGLAQTLTGSGFHIHSLSSHVLSRGSGASV